MADRGKETLLEVRLWAAHQALGRTLAREGVNIRDSLSTVNPRFRMAVIGGFSRTTAVAAIYGPGSIPSAKDIGQEATIIRSNLIAALEAVPSTSPS